MRTWVIVDGERKKVEAVDRGELLLYSQPEWFDRYYRSMYSRYKGDVLGLFIILIICVSTCLYFGLVLQASIYPAFLLPAYVLHRFQFRRGMRRASSLVDTMPGLHQNGLQFLAMNGSGGLFFPYIEMREVRSIPKKPWISIAFGHLGKTRRLYINRDFLGEEGIALLQSLAGQAPSPSPASPPRLVVYPSSDR